MRVHSTPSPRVILGLSKSVMALTGNLEPLPHSECSRES